MNEIKFITNHHYGPIQFKDRVYLCSPTNLLLNSGLSKVSLGVATNRPITLSTESGLFSAVPTNLQGDFAFFCKQQVYLPKGKPFCYVQLPKRSVVKIYKHRKK